MRQPLIVMTLLGALAAAGQAEAQSAKDALEKVKAADKKPPEKTKSEKDKEKEKAKAEKEKAEKEKAEKEKKEKEKAEKKEKKEKEKAEKEAKEKAEKEAKEKAEKEAKEKAEKEKAKDAGAPKDASAPKDAGKEEDEEDDTASAELEELRKTRGDRKKASIEKIKTRWGVLLENPSSKDELAKHAKRMAQLQRIRALAEAKKKVKVVAKVDELITKEELRHGKAMNKLREAGGAK